MSDWSSPFFDPEPFETVIVDAVNLRDGGLMSLRQGAPDGEYEGFWDDEDWEWSCYLGEKTLHNLFNCDVIRWRPKEVSE